MFAPLVSIKTPSIYKGDLPSHLARCTPDMYASIVGLRASLPAYKASLVLSDLYRSYDMQRQAHLDYVTGKKKAYSPPPGGSMHEAGRAFDLELDQIKKLGLPTFWPIARSFNLVPIIKSPDMSLSEAWHFDCRGSHDLVYDYYNAGNGTNFESAYRAMAASAIVSTGQKVDDLGPDPRTGYIQSGLIRLGQKIGNMDGAIGPKSRDALAGFNIDPALPLDAIVVEIERLLQKQFPKEYFTHSPSTLETDIPTHLLASTMLSNVVSAFAASPAFAASYVPPAASRKVLGGISQLVAQAKVINQAFKLPPRMLATLPGKELYLDSELQLDTDGWANGRGKGDIYWQPDTTLRYRDAKKTSIDSNRVPYFVLPLPESWPTQFGISLGDYAAVVYRDELSFAVFADRGPKTKIGEGSIELMRKLGEERLRSNGTVINAGMGPNVITIVFPGSGKPEHRASEATLLQSMAGEGTKRFKALGGVLPS